MKKWEFEIDLHQWVFGLLIYNTERIFSIAVLCFNLFYHKK